jgi:hypothetical protein
MKMASYSWVYVMGMDPSEGWKKDGKTVVKESQDTFWGWPQFVDSSCGIENNILFEKWITKRKLDPVIWAKIKA